MHLKNLQFKLYFHFCLEQHQLNVDEVPTMQEKGYKCIFKVSQRNANVSRTPVVMLTVTSLSSSLTVCCSVVVLSISPWLTLQSCHIQQNLTSLSHSCVLALWWSTDPLTESVEPVEYNWGFSLLVIVSIMSCSHLGLGYITHTCGHSLVWVHHWRIIECRGKCSSV